MGIFNISLVKSNGLDYCQKAAQKRQIVAFAHCLGLILLIQCALILSSIARSRRLNCRSHNKALVDRFR